MEAFAVTPREPYIADRAALRTLATDIELDAGTSGYLSGWTQDISVVAVRIHNGEGRRLLAECTVGGSAGTSFEMRHMAGNNAQVVQPSLHPDSAGRISLITHPIGQDALVVIHPSSGTPDFTSWWFAGCEFTPLPD
jgi:hypothetical protein